MIVDCFCLRNTMFTWLTEVHVYHVLCIVTFPVCFFYSTVYTPCPLTNYMYSTCTCNHRIHIHDVIRDVERKTPEAMEK